MRNRRAARGSVLCALLLALPLRGEKVPPLLRVDAAYLAFSYDHSQIYGERATFGLGPNKIEARYIKIDLVSRSFLACGGVVVSGENTRVEADEFAFDPVGKTGLLIGYGETANARPWPESSPTDEDGRRAFLAVHPALADLTMAKIRQSLLYWTAEALEISGDFEVRGFNLVVYIEGIASVALKSLKLASGPKSRVNGFSLDKVWYTGTQGFFAKAGFSFEREKKIRTESRIYYEEHSILKDYPGLPRQLDFQTETTLSLGERSSLGLGGNYNSTSLWNARVWIDRRWGAGKRSLLLDFNHNKPLTAPGESWLGLQSSFDLDRWGKLTVDGRVETRNQVLANLSYSNTVLKRIGVQVRSDYSRISARGGGAPSEIFSGSFGLSYSADLFNVAGDYFLNRDLFGQQRLARPQLRIGINPVTFYGGILTATLQNVFVMNDVAAGAVRSKSYSDNIAFNLSAQPIFLRPDLNIQVNLAAEQFIEKEGRNFTSGGLILRGNKSFGRAVTLEAFYSFQSRRRSEGWLIEGTSSQDLSGVLRVGLSDRLTGWISASYDPKSGEWKQSFADLTIGLVRNWRFQSLLSYDFFRRRVSNVDLYLIRRAGRLDLRLIWRSISRQFLVELIPAF